MQGSTVGVYNIIGLKPEAEAKIDIQPHEESRDQTRNSQFDGYIFRRCNDGVSPAALPPFMILGGVVAHVLCTGRCRV